MRKPLGQPKPPRDSGTGVCLFKPAPKHSSLLEAAGEGPRRQTVLQPCIPSSLARRLVASPQPRAPGRLHLFKAPGRFFPSFPQHRQLLQKTGLPDSCGPFLLQTLARPAGWELPGWVSVRGQYFHPHARPRLAAAPQGTAPRSRALPGLRRSPLALRPPSQAWPDRSSCAPAEAAATRARSLARPQIPLGPGRTCLAGFPARAREAGPWAVGGLWRPLDLSKSVRPGRDGCPRHSLQEAAGTA